jgi:hypothetical protein
MIDKLLIESDGEYHYTITPTPINHVQLVLFLNRGWRLVTVIFNPQTQMLISYFERMLIIPVYNQLNSPYITALSDAPPSPAELDAALLEGHKLVTMCYWPPTQRGKHKKAEVVVYFWRVEATEAVSPDQSVMEYPDSERLERV